MDIKEKKVINDQLTRREILSHIRGVNIAVITDEEVDKWRESLENKRRNIDSER